MSNERYQKYKTAIQDTRLPAACIDLDLLDQNIQDLLARCGNLPIRIASKSVRSVPVLKYIQEQSDQFLGFMCFTLDEAVYLAEQGLDNLLMGYPSLQPSLIRSVGEQIAKGKNIVQMVDRVEHLDALEAIGNELGVTYPVCIDIDCSTEHFGIYFGVHRSSIKTSDQLKKLLEEIANRPHIKPVGMMGYEAQIAGVTDKAKEGGLKNPVIRQLKKKSIPQVAKRRAEMYVVYNESVGEAPKIFNAGGTGSIESSKQEKWVNEITIGSGFFCSWLFDGYEQFHHEPAAFYALEIVRNPGEGIYTAHGGGYIASGTIGPDKAPQPYLPTGMRFSKNEGAGEVQTPLHYSGELKTGDPVFFRHAKAGELSERFIEYNAIRNGEIVETLSTYRGDGKCFL